VAVRLPRAALPVGLFVACCGTTWWFGGPYFAAGLMTILLCHELGHYLVGRRHGVDISLPYFIPVPPPITLGTLGAVIRMREPIRDRNALFDVGAAGPIAGLIVAVPLLVIGLLLSPVAPIQHVPDVRIEGNSVFYALLKHAVFGLWLPDGEIDVQLHPLASAAWVGLLITMINLMPIGQLDGGHIARAALGDAHERWSRRLHVGLLGLALAVGAVMFRTAWSAYHSVSGALSYAAYGALPWLVWAVLLSWMRWQAGEYHPPVDDVPLDRRRRVCAIVMLLIFFLIATPVPFRPPL
jgi:membrane-associated protease RseP (regulator of RpoE activity)